MLLTFQPFDFVDVFKGFFSSLGLVAIFMIVASVIQFWRGRKQSSRSNDTE